MDLAGVAVVLFVMTSSGVLRMDDQPKSVKDLLVEAKDASELMVDLAYAAVFFNEEKLAERGRASRGADDRPPAPPARAWRCSPPEAPRTPRGWPASCGSRGAIEKIGDAASDIARVVAARLGIPDALRRDLRHADEMTGSGHGRRERAGDRPRAPRALAARPRRGCG